MSLDSWMGDLPDKVKLSQMTMPGSHDAGINPGDVTGVGIGGLKTSAAICQDVDIQQQCMRGSRFFDVRLEVGSAGTMRTYHKSGALGGALGESADQLLTGVNQFLTNHPSETVILRITKPRGDPNAIIAKVSKGPLTAKLYTNPAFVNIAGLELRQLRGRAVCCFDTVPEKGKFPFTGLRPGLGIHSFSRYTGSPQFGVVTCGKYSKSSDLRTVIDGQVTHIDAHSKHQLGDHLFVLYWTQTTTGGNIRAATTKAGNPAKLNKVTGGAHHSANMQHLVGLLTKGKLIPGQKAPKVVTSDRFDRRKVMPNVIMYDFVNDTMSNEIIKLNDPGVMAHLRWEDYQEENPWLVG